MPHDATRRSFRPEVLAALAVLALYAWIGTRSGTAPLYAMLDYHYYPLLADGFLAGKLSLTVEPRPELLALADPYDPVQNQPYRMHDLSLYRGNYYLFSGPAPAILAFAPWKALFHTELPQYLLVLLCASVQFLALAWILGRIVTRFSSTLPRWLLACGVIGLGVSTGNLHLLRWPSVYQTAIAFSACLLALGVLCLYLAIVENRRPVLFLILASLCLAGCVGTRPHFALVALVPALTPLIMARIGTTSSHPHPIRLGLLLLLPLAGVMILMAFYNFARFQNPLETGVRYQLGGLSLLHSSFFSWRNIPFNLEYDFLQPIHFTRQFPYYEIHERLLLRGNDFYHQERFYGLLSGMPLTAFILLLPFAWKHVAANLRGFLGLTLLLSGINFLILLFYATSSTRYFSDFLPPLVLMASLSVLSTLPFIEDRPILRRALQIVFVGTIFYTTALQILLNLPSL